ncbi:MAG: hypothetical protein N3E37_01225 [Candidatus Micrarchaeota archaeon]|nr:hypothetical protein [Candidatus Micrarchaeota archaeon]
MVLTLLTNPKSNLQISKERAFSLIPEFFKTRKILENNQIQKDVESYELRDYILANVDYSKGYRVLSSLFEDKNVFDTYMSKMRPSTTFIKLLSLVDENTMTGTKIKESNLHSKVSYGINLFGISIRFDDGSHLFLKFNQQLITLIRSEVSKKLLVSKRITMQVTEKLLPLVQALSFLYSNKSIFDSERIEEIYLIDNKNFFKFLDKKISMINDWYSIHTPVISDNKNLIIIKTNDSRLIVCDPFNKSIRNYVFSSRKFFLDYRALTSVRLSQFIDYDNELIMNILFNSLQRSRKSIDQKFTSVVVRDRSLELLAEFISKYCDAESVQKFEKIKSKLKDYHRIVLSLNGIFIIDKSKSSVVCLLKYADNESEEDRQYLQQKLDNCGISITKLLLSNIDQNLSGFSHEKKHFFAYYEEEVVKPIELSKNLLRTMLVDYDDLEKKLLPETYIFLSQSYAILHSVDIDKVEKKMMNENLYVITYKNNFEKLFKEFLVRNNFFTNKDILSELSKIRYEIIDSVLMFIEERSSDRDEIRSNETQLIEYQKKYNLLIDKLILLEDEFQMDSKFNNFWTASFRFSQVTEDYNSMTKLLLVLKLFEKKLYLPNRMIVVNKGILSSLGDEYSFDELLKAHKRVSNSIFTKISKSDVRYQGLSIAAKSLVDVFATSRLVINHDLLLSSETDTIDIFNQILLNEAFVIFRLVYNKSELLEELIDLVKHSISEGHNLNYFKSYEFLLNYFAQAYARFHHEPFDSEADWYKYIKSLNDRFVAVKGHF